MPTNNSTNSSRSFKTGSPDIPTLARKLHHAMDKATEELHRQPPEEFLKFVQLNFEPPMVTNKVLQHYGNHDLETIQDIAEFGDQDPKTLLSMFPVSNLANKDFINFVKQAFLLSQYFKEIGESRRNKDTPLHTPNPNECKQYLPNTRVGSIHFLKSIDTNQFQRSLRNNRRNLDKKLQQAVDELLTMVETNNDSIIGSTLSFASRSSRGDTHLKIQEVAFIQVKKITFIQVKKITFIQFFKKIKIIKNYCEAQCHQIHHESRT